MGTILFLTKAWRIWWPDTWSKDELLRYFSEIIAVSGADVLYALAAGVMAAGAIGFAARWPRLLPVVWWGTVCFGVLSVLYAVMSIRVYEILRMPLTYSLLYVAGDVANMRSSLEAFLTPGFFCAVTLLPAFYVGVALLSADLLRFGRTRKVRIAQGAGTVLVLAWFASAQILLRSSWGRVRNDPRMADNPHYTLLASSVVEVLGREVTTLDLQYPPEFSKDFVVVRERPAPSKLTATLKRGPGNVVVVVCETVGTRFLSLYGSKFSTWPRLEAEARHSLVVEGFYSHVTQTPNALASLTLSIYPPMTWRQYTTDRPGIRGTTVANVLAREGYRTAFISAGNNDFANQGGFLQGRGFQTIQDARDSGCPKLTSWGVEDRCMVDMVLRFIDLDPALPFYVFAWTQGTHHPYKPGPEWEAVDFLRDDTTYGDMTPELKRYLNALRETDTQLARLLQGIRDRKLDQDTVVVITGDHGEAFGYPHNTFYHSGNVYEEDVNVPLILWSPSLFPTGQRSSAVGGHVDLSPTILDLLGLPLPADWQGHSLFDPAHPQRAYFHGLRENLLLGVREGPLKYIFNATSGTEELYDLQTDPQELTNLSSTQVNQCFRFRQRLVAWAECQKRYAH